jgi:hypothetical protein
MAHNEPTIARILQDLAAHYNGIVNERELFERVLARRPSRAKDPYAGIREKLRFGAPRVGWVRLGGGELMPLRVALEGLRFRVIPDDDEFAGDLIARSRLEPFVAADEHNLRLEDAAGRPVLVREVARSIGTGLFGPVSVPALDLGEWFRREGFEPGDSIIVTIRATEPLTLRLEREPKAAFRETDVLRQERELLDALVDQLARSRVEMLFPEDSVLAIYARAPWRTGYPGRPWQQLVAADRRLRLVDGTYIAASSFRRPLDMVLGDARQQEQLWHEEGQQLRAQILALQAELRASRRADAESGLWDGIAPRASTARVVFDRTDKVTTIYAGPVDALQDYSAEIEERVARGDYDSQRWMDDLTLEDDDDIEDLDDELLDVADIEDLQEFMEQHPALAAATQRLMASLTPEEVARLEQAETPEDVQRVLTGRLNELLYREPALFAALEPAHAGHAEKSNGHTNGNGHGPHPDDEPPFDDEEWDDAEKEWGEDEEDLLEEDWDEDDEDDADEGDEAWMQLEGVLARSNELMERFYQHLLAQGKSETTATSRTGDLWPYGEFLANYYDRALDEGDYATLDECLFFFYPRKILNSSPRAAREMCTSLKQFYAFLRAEGIVQDDSFAQAMWRRRDQAARVVELYDLLDGESPQFDQLFAHLFAPYTV